VNNRIGKRISAFGIICVLTVAASLSGGCRSVPREKSGERKPFTIVALPDTQIYSESIPDIFCRQTEWIKENREKLNIVCVVHEGDITNRNSEKEWDVANKAMSVLDGEVPYFMAVGNHDMAPGGSASTRDAALFDKAFPPSRFEEEVWYGGHLGESLKNAYYYFGAGGMEFLVLCLEFGPPDEVLDWANRVVREHKGRRIIVVTHCYMYFDDTRVGEGDSWSPHGYGGGGNDGEEMWEKFVCRNENIFLVLSGHILGDGLGRLTSTGERGNGVHQVLANYQMKPNGGDGWLRIMEFVPEENKILVSTYSPFLDEYAEDEQNKFELEYEMKRRD
jgi:hypothetical protein